MGKTVPSFRMALEFEINRWSGFRRSLPSEADRVAFDALMDMCRNKAMAAGNACNPVVFEPMVMSILLSLQIKLGEIERKISDLKPKPDEDPIIREESLVFIKNKTSGENQDDERN